MRRFFGLMPSASIEISKKFKDKSGFVITIDAGKEGWTVIYADSSTNYEDIEGTAEENFERAYKVATEALGELTPIENQEACDVCEEVCGEC